MSKSLRKSVDAMCKSCVYDSSAAGTWRVQTTLCACTGCPLWPHRPKTKSPIPQSVLDYYQVKPGDPCLESLERPGSGHFGPVAEET